MAILSGMALLVIVLLRATLAPGLTELPGRDSGNLYIWEVFNRSALASGQLPFWNPFHFAGTPHLADPQTLVLYPPAMLLRWLPIFAYLPWMAALHVWIGGAGALYLARVIGMSWLAAAASASAVMLGGSVSPWLHNGHLLPLFCAAWFPWAVGLAMRSARRDSLWPHPGLVLVLVMQFLAGYLQGSLYVTAAVSGYFLFNAAWPGHPGSPRWRSLAQLGVLGALACGLSAFQLLPTARLVAEAGRSVGIPYRDAFEGAWSPRQFASFFFPFAGVPGDAPLRSLSDAVAYVGWVLAAMTPMAFLDRPHRRTAIFLLLLTLTAILFVSTPLYRVHYVLFPGLRVPGRLLFIATLGLAMLGGLGLDTGMARLRSHRWRTLLPAAALSAAAVLVATMTRGGAVGVPPAPLWPWFPFVAVAGLAAASVLASQNRARMALAAVLMLVVIDLASFSAGAVALVPVEPAARLKQWMGPAETGRALSICENRIGPGEMLANGQTGVDGPAGVFLGDYSRWAYLARFGNPLPEDGLFHGLDTEGVSPARRDLLDLANVSLLYSCQPLRARSLTLRSRVDQVHAYHNDAVWPRAFWTCGGALLSRTAAVERLLRSRYDQQGRLVAESYVNLRWVPGVDDTRRHAVEDRYQLVEGVSLGEDRTWRYVLEDRSPDNAMALMQDAAVEDTHGLDRGTGALMPSVQPVVSETEGDDLVIGTMPCDARGAVDVRVQDQPDGRVVADVEAPARGYVFLSEPHYVERRAFVDGRPVPIVPANLAFTAVPVDAGRHQVELRYVPGSFHLGLGISGATLVLWAGLSRLARRRRSAGEPG